MMPSLFIAHGAPLLAIENNEYTQFLNGLGRELPQPRGIVLFSAHWEYSTQMVSTVENYDTIYDFGGFPEALYRIQYPARGDKQLAEEVAGLLTEHAVPYQMEVRRGLDHGAWVVLRLLYPQADVPVIAMSVNPNLHPGAQYAIGKALCALRANDVLVIGSGGTVHNLRAVNMNENGRVDTWAVEFEQWLSSRLENWDLDALFAYQKLAPNAQMAVPPYGNEHFIPLFYAMGAADNDRDASLLHRSYRYSNLSHSVWQFGKRD